MARMGRPGLSNTQERELWGYWKAGLSISEIARSLGVPAGNSGFRCSNTLAALSHMAEREDISRGIAAGVSFRRIALDTGRSVSTINCKAGRHGGREAYRAADADERAQEWARRPKRGHLANHSRLRRLVAGRLALQWSPEQFSGWLKQRFPDQPAMRLSHETIYLRRAPDSRWSSAYRRRRSSWRRCVYK